MSHTPVFKIKQNDLLPPLRATLLGADGLPRDLTTATGVEIHVKQPDGTLLFDRPVTVIEDAVAGLVRYDWQTGDTATPGLHTAEFEATFPGAKPETYPNDRHILVLITPELA